MPPVGRRFPDPRALFSSANACWSRRLGGLTVPTQLQVATVKSFCQGSDDLRGANWVILLEEFTFLPAYLVLLLLGVRGNVAIIASLLLADVATFVWAWRGSLVGGGFREARSPSWRCRARSPATGPAHRSEGCSPFSTFAWTS